MDIKWRQNTFFSNQKYEKYQNNIGKEVRLVIKFQAGGLKLY